MGVLTDFVIADRTDAHRVCYSKCPSRDFTGLNVKGIDIVTLGALNAILTGGEFDPGFMDMGDGFICCGGEDGPWVFEVPADLVQRLAKLNEDQLVSAAIKWAATEEFSPKYANWPIERVHQVLGDLTILCKRAAGERKSVLMWMCL
jgi:hypothetical protein